MRSGNKLDKDLDMSHHYSSLMLIISVVLNLSVLIVIISTVVGYPHCVYISLLSKAEDDEGIINLAKHLAKKAALTHRYDSNDRNTWTSFIHPARHLRKDYERRKRSE